MKKLLWLALLLPSLAHGAITYIGAGTASNAIDGGAVTPSVHASTTTGDLILCFVGQKVGTDYTILTSTGYTQLYGRNGASGRSAIVVLGKIATGSDSVSVDSSDNTAGRTVIGQCATFRGTLDTVTGIVDASAGTDNNTQANIDTPALDVTVANSVVIIAGLRKNQFAAEDIAVLSGMDAEIGQPERMGGGAVAMVWDYDIQTTASDKSASAFVTTVNTADAVSIALNIKEAAVAPTWSVSPTVSAQDADDYTLSYTPSTSATFYAVACKKDETAPTIAQVKAGNCTGDAAAIASANEAVTGADTTVLGGSLTRPIHDLYAVLSNAAGDSTLATLADEMLDAPTGYQYDLLASVSATSPCKGLNDIPISPTIAAADVTKWPTATSPSSYAFTAGTDCETQYTDPAGTRQTATLDVYDTSAGDWMSGGPTTVYFNNNAPTCAVANCAYAATLINGVAMTTVDMTPWFDDADGDTPTITSNDTGTGTGANKRPAGTSITSGVWSGTPSCASGDTSGSFTITATDIAGDAETVDVTWACYDQVTVPDCIGLTEDACQTAVSDLGLAYAGYTQCSGGAGFAVGQIMSQYPGADVDVDYGATVRVVRWNGRCPRSVGATIAAKKFVRNVPIQSIDFSRYAELGDAPLASCALRVLGSAFASTTAVGAGTSSRFLTLADATSVSPGDWLKIGAAAYSPVLTVNWTTGLVELRDAETWTNDAAVDALTVLGATIPGLAFTSDTCIFGGTPTASASMANLLIRLFDTNGNHVDLP